MEDSFTHYEHIKDIGAGNFGVAKLMRNTNTNELVAVKFIERGDKINQYVEREILNHIQLSGHPNIIRFKEVFLTPTHLCIAMEYAAGGELFEYIQRARRLSEDHARYFFQQLICGVAWCHARGVCHRDLKLENTLLDGGACPRLKICDFGYSKSAADSQPKSTVGTPAYIAPEVLLGAAYSGEAVDVWSCGVLLYVMLAGAYPFSDPRDPGSFRAMIKRILAVRYTVPADVRFSALCADLLARIFVADPAKRVPLAKILRHPWFLHNLPEELQDGGAAAYRAATLTMTQSFPQVQAIIAEARGARGTVPDSFPDAPTKPAISPTYPLT